MDRRLDRLADVESRLAAVERRLNALESPARRGRTKTEATPAAALDEGYLSSAATHLGRVLLIFGGGYLLRAITDFGFLPTRAGIPTGAAYALLWLFMAWRAGGNEGQRVRAKLYGAVAVLLGLPILVEAVTHFELLTGPQSAVALILFCALVLLVAVMRNLKTLAWLVTAGGLLTGAVLMRASGAAATFVLLMIFLGLVSLWVVYLQRWRGLQWLGAAGANVGVAILAILSASEHWAVEPSASFGLGVALWCAYLLSFAVRSHLQGHGPGAFEMAQAATASVIAFGVAIHAGQFSQGYVPVFGTLALAAGIGSYALAYTPTYRASRGPGYYFYSTFGVLLVIGGSALLASPGKAAVAWSLLAVAAAWLSGRHDSVLHSLHCTVWLLAAGAGSGALAAAALALAGDGATAWPGLTASRLAVTLAAVVCLLVPVSRRSDRWGVLAGVPQLVVLVLAALLVGGLIAMVLAPVFAGVGPSADLGALAALRTAILAVSAVVLAVASRRERWREVRWLAYPVLVAAGVKLVFEDFPHGRPLTLFIALALVGGALMLVSKLMPRRNAPAGL